MQHYTTIEQSKKLLELGLNPDTADMCMWESEGKLYVYVHKPDDINCIPCWSLGALINLMPSTIYKGGETLTLMIYKDAVYHYHICYKSHYHLDEIWFSEENLLNAAFEMVCWLFENGYIKKGD